MRVTITDFIQDETAIKLCDNGYITNGHWIVNDKYMPKLFRDEIKIILEKMQPEIQAAIPLLESLREKIYYRVKPVNPKDFEDEDLDGAIIFQCQHFQIHLNPTYIRYLNKHIRLLGIYASEEHEPVKLVINGISPIELGWLAPTK